MHRMDPTVAKPGPTAPTVGQGLSAAQAAEQLREQGPNALPQAKPRTGWHIAWEALSEPMTQLLLVAGGIYLVLGDVGEALMLLAFVALTLGIGFYQEVRTERALDALRDLSSPHAVVVRGGERLRIPAREVVVGDLLVLSEGDRVPADAQLVQANDLLADESLLTGESVPVRKVASASAAVGAEPAAAARPGGDDTPWVYAGSMLVSGQGMGVVCATGVRSEMGRIGLVLADVDVQPSGLQAQMRRLVRVFGVSGVALSVAVALLHGLTLGDPLAAALAGITLAMSMLPQEFPLILTVFMAMGAWRMARQGVLVRRAAAIEALGSATVLCTDKTGTLTLNRMSVAALLTREAPWRAGGAEPLPAACAEALGVAALASERAPIDPMEQAIHTLALAQGLDMHTDWVMAHEYGLSPELLAMSHVWQPTQSCEHVVAAKGAPEAIASLCHLDEATAQWVRDQAQALAEQGMRVLGVAQARLPTAVDPGAEPTWPAIQHDIAFGFVALLGLQDPLREGVPEAVALCRQAGIRVLMVTGDHPATALAIAKQAGLDTAAGALRGDELAVLADDAMAARMAQVSVFARIMPEQKLRLVRALQAQGEVVAMTGDGVNDAPSLKAAHIGVAMGGRGTDVAREAAAMVLLQDDFGAIPQAVRMGRRIDDNLRKAMAFVLAVHVPIAGLSILPLLMGWPLLFMPVHIAFLELLIDPVCAIVFEAEPEEPDLMRRPPRPPGAAVLSRGLVLWSLLQGLWVLALVALAYGVALSTGADTPACRATAFTALVLANVGLILCNRTQGRHILSGLWRPNAALVRMLGLTAMLMALVFAVPGLRDLFQFAWLTQEQAGAVLALGATALVGLLGLKWAQGMAQRRTVTR